MTISSAVPSQIRWSPRGYLFPVTDTPADEAALVNAVADRDQAALESIFRSYGGAVKAIARRVLHDDTLAEDIVQEVFVALWDNPDGFDTDRGTLRTYLMTIAHRRAVDLVRSEESRTRRQENVVADPTPMDLENEVWVRSQSEAVRAAVGRLRDDERRAISLAYFGGLSYVEVAKELDEPEGTVKSRIRTGMRKLAETLGDMKT